MCNLNCIYVRLVACLVTLPKRKKDTATKEGESCEGKNGTSLENTREAMAPQGCAHTRQPRNAMTRTFFMAGYKWRVQIYPLIETMVSRSYVRRLKKNMR